MASRRDASGCDPAGVARNGAGPGSGGPWLRSPAEGREPVPQPCWACNECSGRRMSTPPPSAEPGLPGAAIIGRGFTADVYAWGDGRVLKLFHPGAPDRPEREYRVTRAVHAAGLPAPAVYELVEVDGRAGIVFERVDGPSLFEYVQARPWKLWWAIRRLAELHAQIHR